ncbi:MAG TPA: cupin domain-containing protein [Solirubrobacteraceae bacterium]|nr:cupin domain-containing protein [Solirubrobacteraceae bacterium]
MLIGPGGGEVIGDSPERRVELLSDHPSLHATWSRFAAGRAGADLHVHRRHTDLFYVLDGELTVRLGVEGAEVVVPAGHVARVPPLVVHGFRNGSDAEMRYLNFHAPGVGFADYMRGIRDGRPLSYDQEPPPDSGTRPPSEAAISPPPVKVDAIAIAEVSDVALGASPALESYYVLEGVAEFVVDGEPLTAEAGSWVQIPPGVEHAASGARLLSVRAPAGELRH